MEERRGHFKAKSANSWATIRPSDPSLEPTPPPEEVDDSPVVVSTTSDIAPARGGIQSSADLRAENARREAQLAVKKAEAARDLAKRQKELRDRGEEEEDPTQTVYRDSSGRKIDVKKEKALKAQERRDELEREMKKMEWGKGEVQKEDKEKRRKEQAEMAFKPLARWDAFLSNVVLCSSIALARYADDKDMNDELKEQDRWNDPAANFLSVCYPLFPPRY